MKKFLSLVLALVMTMSLVTISAGAKDFTDDETITYSEAVAVVSEVGIVDGYTDGTFKPTNTLTRQAAAKIICNLILGPTTASELHANVAPYPDVPTTSEFAGYIAYCQQRGIISGYADGNFRPGNTLTGYAFMKMLLGALGYDATLEGYTGPNWSINVAKQALGIGLADSLELKEGAVFNGLKAVNREEACLYAFNTLQADLVEYGQRLTTSINGTEVTLSSGGAQSKKWANQTQRTRIDNIREDDIIQFAEEYFRKLEKKTGEDAFMRPAYTWIYDREEIGTYVDWTLLKETYTDEVTGRDLYDLLGSALLNDEDMDLEYYVNGVEPVNACAMDSFVFDTDHPNDGKHNITKNNNTILRSNQNAVGFTGRGVLTQVFIDKDVREKIIITSIDTWLAKAGADYNEAKESAPIEVWTDSSQADSDPDDTWNVDVADVPEVADVTEDALYLVNISFKDDANGEIVSLVEPEVLEESVVTKFTTKTNKVPSKVTTGGTEYKQAMRGYYDPTALNDYDQSLLTDRNYNVILDQYGNMIGIELNEGEKHYVFITGFDRPTSNLSVKTADAAAIFLDGTMQEIKVNVTDTDKNILAVNPKNGGRTPANKKAGNEYFLPWQELTTTLGQGGFHALNRWFTYSTNKDGVYTLKPAVNMVAYYSENNPGGTTVETLKTDNLYLDDNVMFTAHNGRPSGTEKTLPYASVSTGSTGTKISAISAVKTALTTNFPYTNINGERCYGNDDSVYITVETDIVDTLTNSTSTITGVTGVYTGAQSVEIELDRNAIDADDSDRHVDEADVYAVYNSNHYIIGAVTTGEANGGNATIAYVTGGVKSERIENGIYYWEFEAIVGGEVKTLTVKEKYGSVLNGGDGKSTVNNEADSSHKDLAKGTFTAAPANATKNWNAYDGLVELRFDADDYVVSVKAVNEKDIYSYYGEKAPTFIRGGNSLTGGTDWTKTQTDRMGDYKAYRIGGVPKAAVATATPNTNTVWTVSGQAHHYDSAPEELKLVSRTLYVTADQSDEGLALASDAKAVVIQRENGKWKTREFSNVSSAVSQVADANDGAPGKQYNGEIVAALNGSGQATWVVFTSYTDLTTGGGANYKTPLTAITVTKWKEAADPYDGNLTFTLTGTNGGQRYTIDLETWNDYQGRWDVIDSINVTGTVATPAVTSTTATWSVGTLNSGHRYRVRCGDIVSAIHVGV